MKRTIRPVRTAIVVFSLLLKVICPLWSQAIVKDLKFQEIPLSTVLDRLSIAAKMRFFYDEHKLRSEIVSITIKERAIDGILYDLLKGLNYSFVYYDDRSIFIVPKDILGEGISSSEKSKTAGSIDYNRQVNPIVVGDEGTVTHGKALVSGLIIDSLTSQELIGASIKFTNIEGPGIVTNTDGHFEFEVTPGAYEVIVEYLGYEPKELLLKVEGNGFISLLLNKSSIDLEEVVINEKADRTNVNEVQIGVLDIDLKEIRQLPAFLGEYDIIKTLIATPGVSSVGEGASGFNVRGGAVDQNLILLNNCDIYNASHALGFFSTFNSDIAKSVSLYKGNIPAKYGGRISSVMDVKYREGNYAKFAMKAGMGPVVSRIMIEGPIIKDKLTFIAGTRFSFVDWILDLTTIQELQKSSANFNDNYFSLSYKPNQLDRIIFSHYSSQDQFSYNREFGFDYDTRISQISYQKLLNSKVSSHTSFSSSRYVSSRIDYLGSDAAKLGNEVSNKRFGQSILWSISHDLALDLGINAVFIEVDPGKVSPLTEASLVAEDELATERASEISLYFSGDCNVSNRLALIGGVRFTQYDFYGPADIYLYNGSPSIES
ncbi:MAG: TonB-dependent receptor, partial [Saprospiraceae bacterium]|nr:TonB-dependent receptor [Saprospiraceae bacterium]